MSRRSFNTGVRLSAPPGSIEDAPFLELRSGNGPQNPKKQILTPIGKAVFDIYQALNG